MEVEKTGLLVKAIEENGEWILSVLGVPYGGPLLGKDAQGEYFTAKTDLWLDRIPKRPIVYYHGLEEGSGAEVIGEELGWERKADGVWFRVKLDQTKALAKRVWEAAKSGLARASSGAISHLTRIAQDGEITVWPVGELSLLDLDGHKRPVNAFAVAYPAKAAALKAVYEQAGIVLPDGITEDDGDGLDSEAEGEEAETQSPDGNDSAEAVTAELQPNEELNMGEQEQAAMTPEEIQGIVADGIKAALAEQEAAEQAEAERQAKIEEEVEARVEEAMKAEREEAAKANRLPFGGEAPWVNKFAPLSKYDHLDAGQTAFAIGLMKAFNVTPPAAAYQSAAVKAIEDDRPFEPTNYMGDVNDERLMLKAMGVGDKDTAAKANEAVYSTSSGFGDQWVTVQYSNQLWPKIRTMNTVLERQNAYSVEVPQGTESIQFHLESTDPTWYVVSQATTTGSTGPAATITTSRIGTGNKSLTVAKLGARVPYTGEVSEDSIIAIVPQIEQQIVVSGAEYLTSLLIDGDTDSSASSNINDIAGTSDGGEWWTLLDGYRKLALVTNTANSRSGGTLTVDDYLETLYLMGAGGKNAFNGNGMSAVSFIQDPNVNKMALRLPEVKTKDVYSAPSIERGMLNQLWGYEVITSYNMHRNSLVNTGYEYKTEATGKIDDDTASDNTKGGLLAVRWDQWRLGYKRRITLENTRFARADLNEIVAMMRVGLAYRDTEASAETYNITV